MIFEKQDKTAFMAGHSEADEMSLGVGDGTGKLFVHGDYESIKTVQSYLEHLKSLKAELDEVTKQRDKALESRAEWMQKVTVDRQQIARLKEQIRTMGGEPRSDPDRIESLRKTLEGS